MTTCEYNLDDPYYTYNNDSQHYGRHSPTSSYYLMKNTIGRAPRENQIYHKIFIFVRLLTKELSNKYTINISRDIATTISKIVKRYEIIKAYASVNDVRRIVLHHIEKDNLHKLKKYKIVNNIEQFKFHAAHYDHRFLQHMDITNYDHNTILNLVKSNGNTIISPKIEVTEELGLVALNQDGNLIKYIPIKTPLLCMTAVNQNGLALKYIPSHSRTIELCMAAVKQNGSVVKNIVLPTFEIALAAVTQYGLVLGSLSLKKICKTPEQFTTIYTAAVTQNGLALDYIPSKDRTQNIIDIAFTNDPSVIRYIDDPTIDMCIDAIKRNSMLISHLYYKNVTNEVYFAALNKNGTSLMHFGNNITLEHCIAAVSQTGIALKVVPDKYKTLEVCTIAVNQNYNAYKYVPEIHKNNYIFNLKVLSTNGLILKFIKKENQTDELCTAAIKQNPNAYRYRK